MCVCVRVCVRVSVRACVRVCVLRINSGLANYIAAYEDFKELPSFIIVCV